MSKMALQMLTTAGLILAAFVFGVITANGSISESISLAQKNGLTALFKSKETFAATSCVATQHEAQDEIFFLSCGGIF